MFDKASDDATALVHPFIKNYTEVETSLSVLSGTITSDQMFPLIISVDRMGQYYFVQNQL